MQKQRIIILASAVLLAGAAVFLVKNYIEQQHASAIEEAKQEAKKKVEEAQKSIRLNQVPVLVAKNDIPAGMAITSDNLEVGIIPSQFVQPQAATSLDRIAGLVTIASIAKGEQITMRKLSASEEEAFGSAGQSLAMSTPAGKRAISVSVDEISSVSGMIRPGDHVDVIAILRSQKASDDAKQQSQVVPLFQNILVLAVGQEIQAAQGMLRTQAAQARKSSGSSSKSLMTLALSPQEANLIAFAQEQGKIKLILRSPTDTQIESIQPASWETLFQYIKPKHQTEDAGVEGPRIEIYRGLNKESISLSGVKEHQ